MMAAKARISTDIAFERDGKQVSALNLEYSVTRSAYGVVPIPIAVIKNGNGPSVLLMGGNHGDEYEGQIILTRLIRSLQPARIQGRLIILPAANLPAALDGARVSPFDGGNLNRSFPGDPTGPPTARIAHYIANALMPMCGVFVDLHSGGTSMDYLPWAAADLPGNADGDSQARAALEAFNAPISILNTGDPIAGDVTAGAAAVERGLLSITGEFGSGGSVSLAGLNIAERGLFRLLAHLGIMELDSKWAKPIKTRLMALDASMLVYSTEDGIFVPSRQLGDEVAARDVAGEIVFPENPERDPVTLSFRTDGLLVCRRSIGRVRRGDCVAHTFTDATKTGRPTHL
jgi:predicted deacylase